MKLWKSLPGAGVLLILAAVLTGCIAGRRANLLNGGNAASEITQVSRGPLAVSISAIGNVRPAQSASPSWQTSGKVGQVLAQTGQLVEEGQVLAELDPASLPNSILQARIDLLNAQNTLEDLYQVDPLKVAEAQEALDQAQEALDQLQNPTATALAQAELAVVDAQEAVDDAQYKLDSLLNGRGNARLIQEARANYLVAQDRVEQVQAIYDNTPGDPNEDAGKAQALSALEGARRDRDRALASLNWYLGEPSPKEMAEAQGNLALAQANLVEVQEALEALSNPTEIDITLAQARVDDAQENLDSLLSGPSPDEVTIAQTRLDLAQANANLAHLTAPFAGTITAVNLLPGDLVSPGSLAFQIDDLSTLYIDLEVSEIDIQRIQVGQQVDVLFDAILERKYLAEVAEIAQAGASSQGVINFTVTVRITDPDSSIRLGMTAEASIQIEQVEDVLQLPNRFIFDDSGKRYVNRLNGEDVEQVFIQVGLTSGSASEVISSELREGDQVTTQPAGFNFGPGGGERQAGGDQP